MKCDDPGKTIHPWPSYAMKWLGGSVSQTTEMKVIVAVGN